MHDKESGYLLLIITHIVIGVGIFILPALSNIYAYLILGVGMLYVVKTQNKNNEVLYVAAYIVGSEVFLRMTSGNPIYEFSKYSVILFMIMGMVYSGLSKNALPYWIYLLLLIPGLLIATQTLSFDSNLRTTISFNISGPLCLGVTALYAYTRKVTLKELNTILLYVGLPIISCTVYLILYTPNVRDVITGTGSNFETSGGFGPNQVATILGLGMFIFFSRIILQSPSKIFLAINVFLSLNIAYRGLITFSRGGMITGIVMLAVLLFVIYVRINSTGRTKLNFVFIGFVLMMGALWSYSQLETDGLIEKRYANQDAAGRVKKSQLTGREDIAASEIKYFLENPIFGIGVAKGAQMRKEETGVAVLSHSEITRMLAEHGALGILALIVLVATPMFLYIDNKQNIYVFCFLAFWLLTISHAAMRLAAPSFIYALSLLIVANDHDTVHRK